MNIFFNMTLNIYSMIVLGIIYIQLFKKSERKSRDYKLFIKIISITFILLFIDILARFDGNDMSFYPYINQIGNFLLFALSPLLPSLWLLYVDNNIFNQDKKIKKYTYTIIASNLLNTLIVILSQFKGYYYYIDSRNVYHRGPLFFISVIFIYFLLAIAFILIVKNKDRIEKKYYFSLILFPLPSSIGIVLQIVFYGYSLALNLITISVLIIFLNIQDNSIYIDHLTGVSNRKRLELYLNDKISKSTEDKTFSAIMIDLNDFKRINDIYGHEVGDHALKTTAELLESCIRANDLVGRFGGDEFYVILDTYDRHKLDEIVSRIRLCIERYNKSNGQLYEISPSIGYDIYDYHSKMDVEDFQKHLDKLMYKNKKAIKKASK